MVKRVQRADESYAAFRKRCSAEDNERERLRRAATSVASTTPQARGLLPPPRPEQRQPVVTPVTTLAVLAPEAQPPPVTALVAVPPRPPLTRSSAPRPDVGSRVAVMNTLTVRRRLAGAFYPGTVVEELHDGRVRILFDDEQDTVHDLASGRETWLPLVNERMPTARETAIAFSDLRSGYGETALAREHVERLLVAGRLQAERERATARALHQLGVYAPSAPVPDPSVAPFLFTLPESGLTVISRRGSTAPDRAACAAIAFGAALLELQGELLARKPPAIVEEEVARNAFHDDSVVEAIYAVCGLPAHAALCPSGVCEAAARDDRARPHRGDWRRL